MEKKLAKINFSEIIVYPDVRGYISNLRPYLCNGYCIDCELKGFLNEKTSISHGADSSDFKSVLNSNYKNNIAVMFLFRDPSPKNNDMGNFIKHPQNNNIEKYIPNNCYYWVLDGVNQPIKNIDKLLSYKDLYSPYLFYLQKKFNLNNIYVTNLTKCLCKKTEGKDNYNKVQKNCVNNFLIKELLIFNPEIIICMGKETCGNLCSYIYDEVNYPQLSKFKGKIMSIDHPSSINYGKTDKWEEKARNYVEKNDSKFKEIF